MQEQDVIVHVYEESSPSSTERPKKKFIETKCEHGKRKARCVDCGGSEICVHKRIRYGCKECKGAGICPHNRTKSECHECGGSRFCSHGKRKSYCKECGGLGLCEHGLKQYSCKRCKGNGICEHNKYKTTCKECKGSQICPHDKVKYECKTCGGKNYCTHGKQKKFCKECDGRGFCEHGKIKSICKTCGGNRVCPHGKTITYCKPCGGTGCCKSPWCDTIPSNRRYGGYCLICYIHDNPDKEITRNYKLKERAVADIIRTAFPDKTWIHDKRITDGCSFRRPDLICDLGSHVIIIEIDEGQHTDYNTMCENKRIMELSRDIGHRPLVIIRFNPDSYTTDAGTIKGCWRINALGTCSITDKPQWVQRTKRLIEETSYHIETIPTKTVTISNLYFNSD
jgi:hypothetical protein